MPEEHPLNDFFKFVLQCFTKMYRTLHGGVGVCRQGLKHVDGTLTFEIDTGFDLTEVS